MSWQGGISADKEGSARRRAVIVWLVGLILISSSARREAYKFDHRHRDNVRVIESRKVAGRHEDWIWPFSQVPRQWTAIPGRPPGRTFGNTPLTTAAYEGQIFRYPQPIPPQGRWHFTLWPVYIGISTQSGWHVRFGFRYDDVDGYYSWPSFTIKKYPLTQPSPS